MTIVMDLFRFSHTPQPEAVGALTIHPKTSSRVDVTLSNVPADLAQQLREVHDGDPQMFQKALRYAITRSAVFEALLEQPGLLENA